MPELEKHQPEMNRATTAHELGDHGLLREMAIIRSRLGW
jgi:hypothetical protein